MDFEYKKECHRLLEIQIACHDLISHYKVLLDEIFKLPISNENKTEIKRIDNLKRKVESILIGAEMEMSKIQEYEMVKTFPFMFNKNK